MMIAHWCIAHLIQYSEHFHLKDNTCIHTKYDVHDSLSFLSLFSTGRVQQIYPYSTSAPVALTQSYDYFKANEARLAYIW